MALSGMSIVAVACGAGDGGLHLGKPVTVGRHHAHAIAVPLEERAVERGAGFVGGDRRSGCGRSSLRQRLDRELERGRAWARAWRELGEIFAGHSVQGVAARLAAAFSVVEKPSLVAT